MKNKFCTLLKPYPANVEKMVSS